MPSPLKSLVMLEAVCRFKANDFWVFTLLSLPCSHFSVAVFGWFYYSCNFNVAFQFVLTFIRARVIKIRVLIARRTDWWGWAWISCWWRWGNAENEVTDGVTLAVNPTDVHTSTQPAALQPLQGLSSLAVLCLFSKTFISWNITWGTSPTAACQPLSPVAK